MSDEPRKSLRQRISALPSFVKFLVAGIVAIVIFLSIYFRSFSPFITVIGFVRQHLPEISSLVITFVSLLAFIPQVSAMIQNEKNRRRVQVCVGAIALLSLMAFFAGLHNSGVTEGQIKELVGAAATQAKASDIDALKGDIRNLRDDTKAGFESVVDAINKLGKEIASKTFTPAKPPTFKPTPPDKPTATVSPLVEHIRFTQRPGVSTTEGIFATQVIIQTDQPSQPTAIRINCDGPLEPGSKFFVAGSSVLMSVSMTTRGSSFEFRFGFPTFNPETPIVVTLQSKMPVNVTSVERLPQ